MQALSDLPLPSLQPLTAARRAADNVRQCLRIGQLASAEMHLAALEASLTDIEQTIRPEPSRA